MCKAFPVIECLTHHENMDGENYSNVESSSGMDLRDYFAAHVIDNAISATRHLMVSSDASESEAIRAAHLRAKAAAQIAYVIADAMLEARKSNG